MKRKRKKKTLIEKKEHRKTTIACRPLLFVSVEIYTHVYIILYYILFKVEEVLTFYAIPLLRIVHVGKNAKSVKI